MATEKQEPKEQEAKAKESKIDAVIAKVSAENKTIHNKMKKEPVYDVEYEGSKLQAYETEAKILEKKGAKINKVEVAK